MCFVREMFDGEVYDGGSLRQENVLWGYVFREMSVRIPKVWIPFTTPL